MVDRGERRGIERKKRSKLFRGDRGCHAYQRETSRTPGRWASWKNVQGVLALTPSLDSSSKVLLVLKEHKPTQLEEVTTTLASLSRGKNEAQTHSCSLPSSQKTKKKKRKKELEEKKEDNVRFLRVLASVVEDWQVLRDGESHQSRPRTTWKEGQQGKAQGRKDQREEGRRDGERHGE